MGTPEPQGKGRRIGFRVVACTLVLALARVALRQSWQNLTAATGEILPAFGGDRPSASNGEEISGSPGASGGND